MFKNVIITLLLAGALATPQPNTCPYDDQLVGKKDLPAHATYCSTDRPPERFQHKERTVRVDFKPTLIEVGMSCTDGNLPKTGLILACTTSDVFGQSEITLPDPCMVVGDAYATIVCHELGHVNGWPAYHGD